MTDDSFLPFHLPAVCRKKVSAAFDGGLVLLREAERSLGLAETLGGCIRDRRNQAQVVHTLCAMLCLWTPPVMQAKFLSGSVHAVKCCRLFGLFVLPSDAAGPYGDARIGSKSLPRP